MPDTIPTPIFVSPCNNCPDGAFCIDWHCVHHPDHPDNGDDNN